MRFLYSIRAACAAAALAVPIAASAQQLPPPPTLAEAGATNFTIFVRGVPIGTEQIAVVRNAGGWMIVSSGRLGAPIDTIARRIEARYTVDWKAFEFTLDGAVRGQVQQVHTRVDGTTAKSEVVLNGQTTEKTDTVDADALLVLPGSFFGPYEALANRLKTAAAGTDIPIYLVPQASVVLHVGESNKEQIQTTARIVNAVRTQFALKLPGAQIDGEIWVDDTSRMIRFSIPTQGLDVVREDIGAVSSRSITISRPNDQSAKIPSNGFTLIGTISRPATASEARLPAVVLVGASGVADRDGLAAGIPILGQIAGALADAGYVVLRYDKRGTGQSGGRAESAALVDYADDVRAAVKMMAERKDVDPKRIAVVGYGEGGLVALIAADKDKRIVNVSLLATPGMPGADVVLAQQQRVLNGMKLTAEERQAKVDDQKKIHDAVMTGKGLDKLPPEIRRSVDTVEFQSLLASDPGKLVSNTHQPLLIVQGELDTQIEPQNADRLDAAARKRKNGTQEMVKVPGVNHLLVPATSGEAVEYVSLKDKHVSAAVTQAIVTWLNKTLSPAR
jgi:pimeloyl-ACP methyl ester carboxylesterase